jgi:integrase
MFKKAVRWGDLHHSQNPYVGIERFKEAPRDRYIEDWEYQAFRKHAGDLIAAYMDFKYLTGLRQGDLLQLRLDQLKEDGIHLTVGKTGKHIIISWTDALHDAVGAIRGLRRPVRGLFLFCNRKGQPYTGNGFRSLWQRRMRSALATGLLKERFREHDIRAKAASDVDRAHATELMAHLDAKTTAKHYRRKPEIVRPLK